MSSKRGRKRNDNLPPNRARDVQRAFRARRANHLQALEQRVAELEEENESFRAALNLPPANRPPLGKGPTGKDKSKPTYVNRSNVPTHPELSSRGDSPSTPPTSSSSPNSTSSTSFGLTSLPQSMENVNSVWDPAIVLPHDDQLDGDGSHGSILPPIADPAAQFRFGQHPQSTSRSSISADLFIPQGMQDFPHSDRPMTFPRDDFSFPPSLSGSPGANLRNLNGNNGLPQHLNGSLNDAMNHQNMGYNNNRRSITEPQHFNHIIEHISHIPYPQQTPQSVRFSPGLGLPAPTLGYGRVEGTPQPPTSFSA